MRWGTPYLRRQYLIAAGAIALLIVGIFAAFGQLLTAQLSRSYLEDVLLSGKLHAEEFGRQMRGSEPTYRVLEQRIETIYKLSAALTKQDIIEDVRFYDEQGKLAFRIILPKEGYLGGFPEGHGEFVNPGKPDSVTETERTYEVTVPMEEYGSVVLTLSKSALSSRIALLRDRLLLHTAIAGGMTVLVLAAAILFIWHLLQRNAMLEGRRLRDAQLAQLGSLAANLAHEIRNPLNALSLNLEILDEDLGATGHDRDTVGHARREVGRLSKLVNDFLVFARPAPPARETCTGADVVADVVKLVGPTCARQGVGLTVDAEECSFAGDRAQLTQVLVNLVMNAVQAMEGRAGSRLEIRVARRGDSEVAFEVQDSGPGIPEADLLQVREAFFSRRKGGTGLGLSIADRIVQEHGGRLDLFNRREGGLVARVTLPCGGNERESER